MAELQNLNENPELAAWLESLKADVDKKKQNSARNEHSDEPRVFLPIIDMGKKFFQGKNKTYPEMQGSINILPVPYKGNRVTEISNVYKCWCPSNDDWSEGFMYKILPNEYYPEGEVRNRIDSIRKRLKALMDSKKIDWKTCKRQTYTLILAYVIMHRNTKGDIVSSTLFGGDTIVEHKYVPALILCPNGKVQTAIQNDLDMKPNAIPYAMACYSDSPLKERKGWVAIKFTDATKGFGYDVTVTTELLNPIIMPDGIIPDNVDVDDERTKLLYSVDPVKMILDKRQAPRDKDEYYTLDSINRLESFVKYLEDK